MPFTPIGDTLQNNHKRSGVAQGVEADAVLKHAEAVIAEIFGTAVAGEVKPLYLKNRTLTITCTSSVVAQEIRLNQAPLVEKINERAGKPVVDRLRYLS